MARPLLTPELALHFDKSVPPTPKFIEYPRKRKCRPLDGMGREAQFFEDPKDVDPETYKPTENRQQRAARLQKEKKDRAAKAVKEALRDWNPRKQITGSDPYRSLFVGRLSYETTEQRLRNMFEVYGPIRSVVMVKDPDTQKPQGYAFLEFETKHGMLAAYKYGHGKVIDGRRVLVDIERGRTVKGWRPRRLGGGLGSSRLSVKARRELEQKQEDERRAEREKQREREERHRQKDREKRRSGEGDRRESREGRSSRDGKDRDRHSGDRSRRDRENEDRKRRHDDGEDRERKRKRTGEETERRRSGDKAGEEDSDRKRRRERDTAERGGRDQRGEPRVEEKASDNEEQSGRKRPRAEEEKAADQAGEEREEKAATREQATDGADGETLEGDK